MEFRIQSVSAIRIFANDLRKSRDFYRALFNLEPIEDSEFFVSFKIGPPCFDITVPDAKNPFSPGGSVGYWLVDRLETVQKRVKDLGGEVYRGPLKVVETQTTITQIRDPFGNIVGFESHN